jgi:sodium-dependent dicarboxylate transporter 2/3/5
MTSRTRTPVAPSTEPPQPHEGSGAPGLASLLAGPALFLLILALPAPGTLAPDARSVAAVAALMAVWWMTEAIPLPATALLPIILFPLLGVMNVGAATAPYAHELIFLFLGGFLIAAAMQRWDLHRRIALSVVDAVGVQPRRLVLGFMLATAFLSMWISNTATVVMMLPIGAAILALLENRGRALGTALMLGIAYAASIGGTATLIGTPPNAIFAAAASQMLDRQIGFLDWMIIGVPLASVMLAISWILLVRVLHPLPAGASDPTAEAVVRSARGALGPMSRGETVVATVFACAAAGWLLREPKALGGIVIPGISTYFPMVSDSVIAISAALVLFAIPVSLRERTFALDWDSAVDIPWGVLLLFGGGLSLARGFDETGLAAWIGLQVATLDALPFLLLLALIIALFVFLTELTSNTATATMGMPIMVGVASGVGAEPIGLMAAVALASSMAFMLPVATPPNAIVFGSGRVSIRDMAGAGLWLNLVAIVLITLTAYLVIGSVLTGSAAP